MKKKFLQAGKIVATHGLHGELRAQSWCDNLAVFASFERFYLDENGIEKITVLEARAHKNIVIFCIEGVTSIEETEQLIGRVLYAHREDFCLEKDTYFIEDLLGVEVIDYDNETLVYGHIVDVTATGANDVYHIKQPSGEVVLIPSIKQVVRDIDLEQNVVRITPLEGLFSDAD